MSTVKKGWERRHQHTVLAIRDVGGFFKGQRVGMVKAMIGGMTTLDEREKYFLWRRFLAVQELAERMMENMIKGVVKYEEQVYSQEEWAELGMDDLVDAANYAILKKFDAEHDDIPEHFRG